MIAIVFTQFVRPHGERRAESVRRPQPVEDAARKLVEAGCRFEIEVLRTGEVSMEVMGPDEDDSLWIEVCPNGPAVPEAVDRLVEKASEVWEARGR